MDAPDIEVRCGEVLAFWGLICRLDCGHTVRHFGDDGAERAGYWGAGIVHVERVTILEPV